MTVQPTNPNYRDINGPAANAAETVFFSTEPALGSDYLYAKVGIRTWQVTPQLKADLPGGWQVRALGSYGESRTKIFQNSAINAAPLAAAVASGALNPFNFTSSSAAVLDTSTLISRIDNLGEHTMWNARIVGDGALFSMPGGDVRASLGAEYLKIKLHRRSSTSGIVTEGTGSVASTSLFGELFFPIFSEKNAVPGIRRLDISASGRYDHYDGGVGGTFNPKLALTYEPAEWLTVRGSWGKSFNAPTAADRVGQKALISPRAIPCPGSPCLAVVPYDSVRFPLAYIIAVTGATAQNLQNQTARNWAAGLDLRPPMIPGLTLSATYYDLRIKNLITLPGIIADQSSAARAFPELYQQYPGTGVSFSDTRIQSFLTSLFTPAQIAALGATIGSNPVVFVSDGRTRNLANFKITGIDMSASYQTATNFGGIDLRFNGNYKIKRDFQAHPGDPLSDFILIEGVPKFTSQTVLGVDVGNFRGQVTWNHLSQAKFLPAVDGSDLQDTFGAFDTFDLFFRYRFGEAKAGFAKGLSFTITANNVFDKDPPVYRSTSGANLGFARDVRNLGRVVLLGADIAF